MLGDDLTTSRHLVQPPRFRAKHGEWTRSFDEALFACRGPVTWDVAGLHSLACFFYSCGDRTLVGEIRRQPWMSQILPTGDVELSAIPNHDLQWTDQPRIANELRSRLNAEILRVCRDRRKIYLFLSGGLDSRIVAGVLADAYRRGNLAARPVALTWGFEDSRDVVYAREVARICEFEWVHIPSRPADLVDNLEAVATYLGSLVPAVDIHRVLWCKNLETDSLVLAGSYGDSVGRGEFSGRTLLELQGHVPTEQCGLIKPEFVAAGRALLMEELAALHDRKPDERSYVRFEHEQQCHYMRGLFGLGLGLVGRFCDFYQAFTAPEVYGFMWSLHPALRTDEPYSRILEACDPKLARLPWARTNRAISGRTEGARAGLNSAYHDYAGWICGPLYDELRELVDARWFEESGVFDGGAVSRVDAAVRADLQSLPGERMKMARLFLWLATVRRFADVAKARGIQILPPHVDAGRFPDAAVVRNDRKGVLRRWLLGRPSLRRWVKKRYADRLRAQSIRRYPPTEYVGQQSQRGHE